MAPTNEGRKLRLSPVTEAKTPGRDGGISRGDGVPSRDFRSVTVAQIGAEVKSGVDSGCPGQSRRRLFA
jgi:hypothetical protein